MPDDHLTTLDALLTRFTSATPGAERAAVLAELQCVAGEAMRESVAGARRDGVSWRTLAAELRIAPTSLRRYVASERPAGAVDERSSGSETAPVPRFTDSFFGREKELSLLARMPAGRLVTLTGPGGIGKTRLAAEFLRRFPGTFGNVWWIGLAPAHTPAEAVRAALGPEPAETITKAGPALLVLDGGEHVTDECARLVTELRSRCEQLSVLVSSRERLDVPGERVFGLGGLGGAAAVALFTDRAGEGRDIDEVAGLDGLPLAIELAARGAGSGGLDASIRRSYSLLTDVEREVFRRITVFAGGFERDDAAAVCAGLDLPAGVLWAVLGALVAKSLVAVEDGRLYVLESLRRFGNAELERHGKWDGAVQRLLNHLARFEPSTPPAPGAGRADRRLGRVRHRANLELAVTLVAVDDPRYPSLVIALDRARRHQAVPRGCRALIEAALVHHGSYRAQALLQNALSVGHTWDGEYAIARSHGERAVRAASGSGDRRLEFLVVGTLAEVCERLGDLAAMEDLQARQVHLAREVNDPYLIVTAFGAVASARLVAGRLDEADAAIRQGLAAFTDSLRTTVHSDLFVTAGLLALRRGNVEDATRAMRRALVESDAPGQANGLAGLALAAVRAGEPERALRLYGAAVRAWRDPGSERRADVDVFAAAEREARELLDAAAADRLLAEGAAMDLHRAVAYALSTGSPLTAREAEVATLVSAGHTNGEIAARLGISARTVASHLESVRAKLGLSGRAHVTAWITRFAGVSGSPTP